MSRKEYLADGEATLTFGNFKPFWSYIRNHTQPSPSFIKFTGFSVKSRNYLVAFSRCTPSFISLPRLGATYSPASVISILTISLFEHIFYANHGNHPNLTCLKPNYSFFFLSA